MRAATYIMSDDLEGAEAGLEDGHSAFHKVRLFERWNVQYQAD